MYCFFGSIHKGVVGYFFALICPSPHSLFRVKCLEFLCFIKLKETAKVFFPHPETYRNRHTLVFMAIGIYTHIYLYIRMETENALFIGSMTKFSAGL